MIQRSNAALIRDRSAARVHREFFRDKPDKFDLRDVGVPFMDEYAKMIAGKNQMLGSAGHLDEVRAALAKK